MNVNPEALVQQACLISVGDIAISGRSLKSCRYNLGLLLKNRQVKKYLKINRQKKLIDTLSYVS